MTGTRMTEPLPQPSTQPSNSYLRTPVVPLSGHFEPLPLVYNMQTVPTISKPHLLVADSVQITD